jgi:Zn-dependent alcohol dehydrogenase
MLSWVIGCGAVGLADVQGARLAGAAQIMAVGPCPQQLALALLADHLGDAGRARQLSGPFMRKVIAELDNAGS